MKQLEIEFKRMFRPGDVVCESQYLCDPEATHYWWRILRMEEDRYYCCRHSNGTMRGELYYHIEHLYQKVNEA